MPAYPVCPGKRPLNGCSSNHISESEALEYAARSIKSSLEKMCLSCCGKELNVSDEQIESGREFQMIGAAAQKEQELKM